MRAKERIP